MKASKGTVYLVGAGPGDPGLITQRGLELLRRAEVIFYDNLVNPALLSFSSPVCEKIYVGKRGEGSSTDQRQIEDQLVESASRAHRIVRLKGGDPFIFGRGGEESQRLAQEGIPYEVVPGVTSAIAAPAYAGIPLTHRNITSAVAIVTGHFQNDSSQAPLNWGALAQIGTLVFLMSVKTLRQNMKSLIEAGKDPKTPVAFIRWGSYARQETYVGEIGSIADEVEAKKLMPPAVVVVGEVVKLREEIAWFEKRPLFGKTVLVTRARAQASEAASRLSAWGAEVWELPCLEFLPPEDLGPLDQAILEAEKYDWLFFTSVNAVAAFFARWKELKRDIRALANCKIAAVGPATAQALNDLCLQVDKLPSEYRGDQLAEAFAEAELRGKRVLFPRAKEGREDVLRILDSKGGQVTLVEAYQTRLPELEESLLLKLRKQKPDCILFASSSAVRNFMHIATAQGLRDFQEILCLCIGPQTLQEAHKSGFTHLVISPESSLESLLDQTLRSLADKS